MASLVPASYLVPIVLARSETLKYSPTTCTEDDKPGVYIPAVWSLVLPPATLLFSHFKPYGVSLGLDGYRSPHTKVTLAKPIWNHAFWEQERHHISLMRASLVGTPQWGGSGLVIHWPPNGM